MTVTLKLHWPPSVNHYWRMARGRMVISQEGREYREFCRFHVYAQVPRGWKSFGENERLAVEIEARPPDRRVRDLDNLLKSLLDSMAHAGVYASDGQIDELTIRRGPFEKGGSILVRIRNAKDGA